MTGGWRLHPRLEADTHAVTTLEVCELRLMDDAQYPWLILVPRVPDAVEIIDLDEPAQHALLRDIGAAGRALRALFAPDKLNVAALGNVVAQLHVHVVGRHRDDAAWPRPVWGAAPAVPHAPDALAARIGALRGALAHEPR